MSIQAEALALWRAGYSVLPIALGGSKSPHPQLVPRWGYLKTIQPLEHWVRRWFICDDVGIAVIGGKVSGGLEVLDFDDHNENLGDTFEQWRRAIPVDLYSRLVVYSTPKNGWRVCYRCEEYSEKAKQPIARLSEKDCIIEVLTSSIILVPGGHPAAHSLNKPYVYVQGHLCDIAHITPDERIRLHLAARPFNRFVSPPKSVPALKRERPRGLGCSPGDDFNTRGTWAEILEPAGWEPCGGNYWRRPGKNDGISASTDYYQGVLYVFSVNAGPLEAGRAYSKFSAYTHLHHDGDFKAAAAALRQQDYGGMILTEEQKERLRAMGLRK